MNFVFVTEGRVVAKTLLQSALELADTSARAMASTVTMRRASWFQISGIILAVQQATEDLPFNGQTLFSNKTDETLYSFKDLRTTLRSLQVCTTHTHRDIIMVRSSSSDTGCKAPLCSPSPQRQ